MSEKPEEIARELKIANRELDAIAQRLHDATNELIKVERDFHTARVRVDDAESALAAADREKGK